DRPRVPGPTAIRWPTMEKHLVDIGASPLQDAPDARFGFGIFDGKEHELVRSEQSNNLRIEPWDRRELAWPVLRIVWPCQPGCLVRLPLGRHAIVQRARRGSSRFLFSH